MISPQKPCRNHRGTSGRSFLSDGLFAPARSLSCEREEGTAGRAGTFSSGPLARLHLLFLPSSVGEHRDEKACDDAFERIARILWISGSPFVFPVHPPPLEHLTVCLEDHARMSLPSQCTGYLQHSTVSQSRIRPQAAMRPAELAGRPNAGRMVAANATAFRKETAAPDGWACSSSCDPKTALRLAVLCLEIRA